MRCDHCQRRFRLAPVDTDHGRYCSEDCATEGAEAADNRPCKVCKQYHADHCPGPMPRMRSAKQSRRIETMDKQKPISGFEAEAANVETNEAIERYKRQRQYAAAERERMKQQSFIHAKDDHPAQGLLFGDCSALPGLDLS